MVTRRTASPEDAPPPAGSLQALAAQADTLGSGPGDDGAPGAGAAPPQAEPEPIQTRAESNAFRIGVLFKLARDLTASPEILNPPLRCLKEGAPDAVVEKVATAWGVALDEMGVDFMGGFDLLDHPAAKAALITAPILWPLGRALWLELRERKPIDAAPPKGDPASGE